MRRRYIALAAALALLTPDLAGAGILKGPFLQLVSKSSATIVWQTDAVAPGSVEWGATSDLGARLESGAGSLHRVTIDGLTPDTAYYYRVSADGQVSQTYPFTTAPGPERPLRVVLYGDSRSGYAEHRRVADGIELANPDIYLNTGDIVCTGTDELCWQEHFDIERELMATRPLLPVIGNHDVDGLNADNYLNYFVLPEQAGSPERDERYYYQDWGCVRFIVLDSETSGLAIGSPQHEWLMQTLAEAQNDPAILHVIVGVHEGPYTAKPGRSGNASLRAIAADLVDAGVTMVVSGHDHHYYRGTSAEGLQFIVAGGGGAGLYDCEPRPDFGVVSHVCSKTHHHLLLEIEGRTLSATATDSTGAVIDTFEWTSRKEETTPIVDGDGPDRPPAQEYQPAFGFAGCGSAGAGTVGLALLLLLLGLRRRARA